MPGSEDVTPLVAMDNINTNLIQADYAVRGAIVQRAEELERQMEKGAEMPFDKMVFCNIGNPQQLGQKPITFIRQVIAICDYPELMDQVPPGTFPSDVLERAKEILRCVGSTGAYSHSKGSPACRRMIAAGIEERDGFPCDPDNIFMTDGASPAVHNLLKMLIRNEKDGWLVPVPQYPLYSAGIQLSGGALLPYYLHEENNWGLNTKELQSIITEGRDKGLTPRAMVVINPGNPTGQCLSLENQEEIVRFCKRNNLVLISDEVYQTNVYVDTKQFYSFKKVMCKMGEEAKGLQLVSLHSVSKGFMGECGRRGGYMEAVGMCPAVLDQLLKAWSINLCPNVSGQVCMANQMQPPKPGQPSYELYAKERDAILGSLRRRAQMLVSGLNKLEGVTCQPAEGAMYAFPAITLPDAAVQAAAAAGQAADSAYCMACLEATGIVIVPGSGFKQKEGTWHFRTTILPSEDDIGGVVDRLSEFHRGYLAKFKAVGVAAA